MSTKIWNVNCSLKIVSNTFPMCRICCLTLGDRLRLRAEFKFPELCLSLLRDIPLSLRRTPLSLLPLLRLLSSRERKCWNIQTERENSLSILNKLLVSLVSLLLIELLCNTSFMDTGLRGKAWPPVSSQYFLSRDERFSRSWRIIRPFRNEQIHPYIHMYEYPCNTDNKILNQVSHIVKKDSASTVLSLLNFKW